MRYAHYNSGNLDEVFKWMEEQGDDITVLSFAKETFDYVVIIDRGPEDKDEDDKPKRMGRPKGSKNKPKEASDEA